MSQFPCQNPSCKSYGKPHPNCRCYGLAEGGEVGHFCDGQKDHNTDCEYYADGGLVDDSHIHVGHVAHHGLYGILKANSSSDKGHKDIHSYCKALFAGEKLPEKDVTKHKDHIHEWINKGGIVDDIQNEIYSHHEPKQFAEGGKVETGKHSDLLSHATKGRVSDYLNSLRPQDNLPKLAFDHDLDQSDKKRSYAKALHLAAHPLSVMHEVNKGTIEPEHIAHLNSMYPEFNEALKNKVVEHITKAQLEGNKPPHRIRQGLGLLLGSPLSSEMTPENMQAAQSVFTKKATQQTQPGMGTSQSKKPKQKSQASLSKSDQSFLTGGQSLVARSQRQS